MNWLADILESLSQRLRRIPVAHTVVAPEIPFIARRAEMLALTTQPGFRWIVANLHNIRASKERQRATLRSADAASGLDSLIAANATQIRLEEAIHWLDSIERLIRRAEAMPDLVETDNKE